MLYLGWKIFKIKDKLHNSFSKEKQALIFPKPALSIEQRGDTVKANHGSSRAPT